MDFEDHCQVKKRNFFRPALGQLFSVDVIYNLVIVPHNTEEIELSRH